MMTVELLPTEVFLSMKDVARYVGRTPQAVMQHRATGLLRCRTKAMVRLDDFNRYLAKKYPQLPRLESATAVDEWRAKGSPVAERRAKP